MKNITFCPAYLFMFILLAFSFTACQQEELPTPTSIDPEISQVERDAAIDEANLIKSYGPEVTEAYEAYMNGEELDYYSPLGYTDPVEFDWANYAQIMEHSKILEVVENNGMIETYMEHLPVGTYLTRAHMKSFTPELLSLLDSPNETRATTETCYVVHDSGWNPCGSCYVAATCLGCCGGGCMTIVLRREYCRTISTTCSCHSYTTTGGC